MAQDKMKNSDDQKGMLQVYTGDGRGKTSAAIGLAIRALGAGLRPYLIQFIKSMEYSEVKFIKAHDLFPTEQLGLGCMLIDGPSPEDCKCAEEAWQRAKELLQAQDIDLLILDEINIAIHMGLLDAHQVTEDIKNRRPGLEVITTGRKAPKELIEAADLVTDMEEVDHYYKRGILSRKGFDR